MNAVTPLTNQLPDVQQVSYALMEKVLIDGDLSRLTPKERVELYKNICTSLNLNPLTRPFQYINFDGKLTLYASKNCTEQLRNLHTVSIIRVEKETTSDGVFLYTAYAQTAKGQTDVGTGAVNVKGLAGKALANAYKVAETQAKRRVTLSICGLGWTDESEVPDVPNAKMVNVDFDTGEIKPVLCDEDALLFCDALVKIEMSDTYDGLRNVFADAWRAHTDETSRAKLKAAYDLRKADLDKIVQEFRDELNDVETTDNDKEEVNESVPASE